MFKPGNLSKAHSQDGLLNAFTGFGISAFVEYADLFSNINNIFPPRSSKPQLLLLRGKSAAGTALQWPRGTRAWDGGDIAPRASGPSGPWPPKREWVLKAVQKVALGLFPHRRAQEGELVPGAHIHNPR